MNNTSFATAVSCIDGRIQLPVINFIKQKTGVEYVDMITEPGMVKRLATSSDERLEKLIRKSIEISIAGHNSKHLFIIAHNDCLANPVTDQAQKEQLSQAKSKIESYGLKTTLSCLWVNSTWQVEELSIDGRGPKGTR